MSYWLAAILLIGMGLYFDVGWLVSFGKWMIYIGIGFVVFLLALTILATIVCSD